MDEKNNLAEIERYLAGEMSAIEASSFARRLEQDPNLSLQLEEYRYLISSFQGYHHRVALKEQLNLIHEEMEQEVAGEPMVVQPAVVRSLWRQHYTSVAVAASVILFTGLTALFSMNLWHSTDKKQTAGFQELRREVDRIKRNQLTIIQDIQAPDQKIEIHPGNFSGTGFALTAEGYVVTSFHVIEGADSVFIESSDGTRFKMKLVHQDRTRDLAILRVTDPGFTSFGRLPYTFRRSVLDLGERVYTLGFPREDLVYGEGSISARTGFSGDSLSYQISVPVNPGNSGGPLLDGAGNLIGVISGKQLELVGTAFAIKSRFLLDLIDELPGDSLEVPLKLPQGNLLNKANRPQQLKKLKDFIFVIKVYNQPS